MSTWKRPAARQDLPDWIPFSEDLSVLAQPLTVGTKTVPNRICYQPMEGCDGTAAGAPDTLTARRYHRFAAGGAGLIWFEATAVVREGRANPRQLMLTEETADTFAALLYDIRETCLRENGYAPVVICQLTHSGRWSKPEGRPAPMAAGHNPFWEKDKPVDDGAIVSDEYLCRLPEKYAAAARLCEKVGFDGADIKACHGYLLSELLHAYTRPGIFGGDYENRTRAFFEAVDAVRAAVGRDFIAASRFNAYDGYPYPYGIGDSGTPGIPDFSEAARIAKDLSARGVSLLNVTMGCPYTNHEVNRPTVSAKEEPPYRSIERMMQGAAAVTAAAPKAAVAVSALSYLGAMAPGAAAAQIKAGAFHFAGFGRQSFACPDLARDILQGGGMRKDRLCLTCGKCTELMRAGSTPGCVIYDKEIYTRLYTEAVRFAT